jgi:mRNA interferase RelE/StbE
VASYSVLVTQVAARQLEAIGSRRDRERVAARIAALADDPRPHGIEKLSGHEQKYRVRQGDYRILFEIEDQRLIVYVIKVGHRRDVYKRGL